MLKIAHSLSLALGFVAACACGLCGIERSNAAEANGGPALSSIVKNSQRSAKSRNSAELPKRISLSDCEPELYSANCQCVQMQLRDALSGRLFFLTAEKINVSFDEKIFTRFHLDPSNPIRAPALRAQFL